MLADRIVSRKKTPSRLNRQNFFNFRGNFKPFIMKSQISSEQVQQYQDNGFIVIENFLSPEELEHWRKSVNKAVEERAGIKIPGKDIKTGEADGINEDSD